MTCVPGRIGRPTLRLQWLWQNWKVVFILSFSLNNLEFPSNYCTQVSQHSHQFKIRWCDFVSGDTAKWRIFSLCSWWWCFRMTQSLLLAADGGAGFTGGCDTGKHGYSGHDGVTQSAGHRSCPPHRHVPAICIGWCVVQKIRFNVAPACGKGQTAYRHPFFMPNFMLLRVINLSWVGTVLAEKFQRHSQGHFLGFIQDLGFCLVIVCFFLTGQVVE